MKDDKHQPETARPTNFRDNQMANVGRLLTKIKATWHHLNPILPQQQVLDTPNTPEKQDLDLKSQLMMLIEGFKKDINNSFHNSSSSKENKWNTPTKGGKLHNRNSKKLIFF